MRSLLVSSAVRRRGVGCQFARFLLVGVSNTAISALVYAGLLGARVPVVQAAAVGFAAGAANGYVLNRRWTFVRPDTAAARLRYLAVQLGGLGGTTALVWLLAGVARMGNTAGYAATLPIVTLATFAANRAWTFA